MKYSKKILAVILSVLTLLSCILTGASALNASEEWADYFESYTEEGFGIILEPGSNENERNFSWYSPVGEKTKLTVSDNEQFELSTDYYGKSLLTPDGDKANKVTVTGLKPGSTYYYRVTSGDKQSPVYSFATTSGNEFTAMYVTDIHVSRDQSGMENSLVHQSYTVDEVVKRANSKKALDLIVSAGDQASNGRRDEYEALVASPAIKSIPFALDIGNHDRKCIDYRFFNNNPNQNKTGINSFNGGDYWFVKGSALFMVMDSNCTAASTHRRFMKNAIDKNPGIKWRIAVCHHDMFGRVTGHREEDVAQNRRPVMVPLFDEFGVDLVLLGHSHFYSISNVLVNSETVESLKGKNTVTDADGTIYMVSGSINRPKTKQECENTTPNENCAYVYDTDDIIYNLLSFGEGTLTIDSYTYESDELFNTFTINKTSVTGGHEEHKPGLLDAIKRSFYEFLAMFEEFGTRIGKTFVKFFEK